MSDVLTLPNSSYFKRIKMWSDERFPVVSFISAAFMYFYPKSFAMLFAQNIQWHWTLQDLGGFLFVASILFVLRVLDEHKDFADDIINHPERVLQRGIVSLQELRVLGAVFFALHLLSLFLLQIQLNEFFVVLFIWTWIFLMFKEFFVKKWLRKKLVLYSFLHLLISPAISVFFAMKWFSIEGNFNQYLSLVLIAMGTGWIYEITRKCRSREEEHEELSFSKIWGLSRCVNIIIFNSLFVVAMTLLQFWQMHILNTTLIILALLFFALHVKVLISFKKTPNKKASKANLGMAFLLTSFAYIVPVVWSWV